MSKARNLSKVIVNSSGVVDKASLDTTLSITGTAANVTGTVAIANGGTGATTAANARTALGVTATGADTTYAYRANNLSDLASASTARTNLGLGTAATTAATDYATAAQGTKADSALQPAAIGSTVQAWDADLDTWATKTAPTGTVVGTSDSQALTNKTISGASNTLSNIGNSSLTNSSITINGSAISLGGSTSVGTVTSITGGSYLTGGTITGSGTLAVDATSTNTASKVVARDASGNFAAGTITAALSGNATTATTLATGRTIAITGDLSYTSPSFDGSSNVTATGTLATVNSNTGSFGSSTAVPVITVNGKGLITAVSTASVSGSISVTGGDLTLSGNTGTAITNATLATVNSTTGTFGSSSSIPVVTVNGKGLVTAVSTATVAGGQYFGSAATKAIAYNSTSIAENITTTTGNNCLSVGPITIASGNTVTIASGQRWVIL